MGQEFMGSSGQNSLPLRGRLQVSKVGPSFNWQAFQTHLDSYGQILKTSSQTDDDDQSLLTCFVEFADPSCAKRAADDLNGIDFDGSRLELAYFEEESKPAYDDMAKQRLRAGGRNRPRYNRQNSHANMPLRILIPADMVGAVIGKGGEAVRKMSSNTNARIDVHRTVNINGFKPVTITGQSERPGENCSAAFREIHQKIIEETKKKLDGNEEQISVPMRMLAPDLLMGRVIGKGGKNLKEIKVKTSTKIDATRDPVTPVFNERIITIEDPSLENPVEKCSNAEEEISRILRKSYQDDLNNMANMNGRMGQSVMGPFSNPYLMAMIAQLTGGRGFNGMPPAYMANGMNPGNFMGGLPSNTHHTSSQKIEKIHIAVPKNSVGAIIGREGSVVNGIRQSSGASVQVLNSDEDAMETLVELRGYPYQLSMAEGAIFQKIQEQGFAGHPNQTVQLRTEIKIPPEAVGRIIGKRGSKVRSLQGRHRALVEVPRTIDPEETEVIVRVVSDYLGSQGVQTEIREIVAQVEAQQRK
ncbi:insulin-like growth factor 2 mRNA-binding protein 2 isoform X2 [Xenia sp. Carnegie-2017]|uniref:insulin-like growth factor 2 mRNA-binding protein 2 isoform X2 n=1 Tax=Xenia sp. Carnegie-2017 TaxID=2897299 RepID=UPI001F04E5F9|nr:insulin-like growth factor 2 mRNA-binding protein 2 isoform X2 [Xenia sp. Carnegie-2017]